VKKSTRRIAAVVFVVGVAAVGTVLAQTAGKPADKAPANAAGIVAPKIPIKVQCPVQQITVGVETPAQLPSPWWDTPFVEHLTGTALTTVGGKPGIACLYAGSGKDWSIARPLDPDYASCTPQGTSFSCIGK
jgi:hypothetical protein